MAFTDKAFIVCDLGRRGADLWWPTLMPFNTVINPDAMMGTMVWGLLWPLSHPAFVSPSVLSHGPQRGAGRGIFCGSSHVEGDGRGLGEPETSHPDLGRLCSPPGLQEGGNAHSLTLSTTAASPGPGQVF